MFDPDTHGTIPLNYDHYLVPANAFMTVEVGSTAHGTGLPGHEDLDLVSLIKESATEVIGLGNPVGTKFVRTKPEGVPSEPGDVDVTIYPLRKFLKLASEGNPSVLMVLWSPLRAGNLVALRLRHDALRGAFVGRHIIPKYRGYMSAQAQRLLGIRGGRVLRDNPIGWDTKYAMHCARLGIQCLELLRTGNLSLPVAGEDGDWLRLLRSGGVSFDEWWERVLDLDAQLGDLRNDESIPPGPNLSRIERFSVREHLNAWGYDRSYLS